VGAGAKDLHDTSGALRITQKCEWYDHLISSWDDFRCDDRGPWIQISAICLYEAWHRSGERQKCRLEKCRGTSQRQEIQSPNFSKKIRLEAIELEKSMERSREERPSNGNTRSLRGPRRTYRCGRATKTHHTHAHPRGSQSCQLLKWRWKNCAKTRRHHILQPKAKAIRAMVAVIRPRFRENWGGLAPRLFQTDPNLLW